MKIKLLILLLATPLAFCNALDNAFTPDDNTLSLWVFDAGSGDKVANKTFPGIVGEFSGGVKWIKDDVGTGLEFNGENGQINIPKGDFISIAANSPFTMDILVRVPPDATLVGSIYKSGSNIQIEYRNAVFTICSSFWDMTESKSVVIKGKTPVNDGKPHRITLIRDVDNEKLIQFVDGKFDRESPCPKTASFRIPHVATIGGEAVQTPNLNRRPENFQGVIYSIHISKIARIAL